MPMKKILVIEDAHSLRRDILEMLSFEGYDVVGAEDGLVGVDRAREVIPDLIICDIMMPGRDGYGVLEELRRDPATASIPFIFLTARTDRVDVRQGMELGADDYLTKPFTASELLATVSTRIEKRVQLTQLSDRKLEDLRENIILALPHELRTPLNVILGFSDLMMSDYNAMEPARMGEMARHINNAALRLYRLIENFLIYANVRIMMTSPDQFETLRTRTTFGPKSTIEFVAYEKAEQAGRAADMMVDLEDVPMVRFAEEYLRKTLEEIIDNALKFSDAGTEVVVLGRREGDRYVVSVTDRGRGMTSEQVASIGAYMQFDRRFYEQQGSGLGLAIARQLVELYDGTLDIVSRPSQGTTMKVSLQALDNGL
jgi:signal transduction histidine kinase